MGAAAGRDGEAGEGALLRFGTKHGTCDGPLLRLQEARRKPVGPRPV